MSSVSVIVCYLCIYRSPDQSNRFFWIGCVSCLHSKILSLILCFGVGLLTRYHESQLSEADWHLHSTHDPDEVQVDPRALSDVTDEEEVQVCVQG